MANSFTIKNHLYGNDPRSVIISYFKRCNIYNITNNKYFFSESHLDLFSDIIY